jgi:hypothetical protein
MNTILNYFEIINKDKDKKLNFQFNEWLIELDIIDYSSKCSKIICKNFMEWLESDKYKTFPKKKNKWKNIFRTHANIYEIKIQLDVGEVLENLKFNKPIPKQYESVYNTIKNYINFNSFNCNIPNNYIMNILKEYCLHINYLNENEIFNILFENGYLLLNEKNEIIINKSILNNTFINKKELMDVLENSNADNLENIKKKRKVSFNLKII